MVVASFRSQIALPGGSTWWSTSQVYQKSGAAKEEHIEPSFRFGSSIRIDILKKKKRRRKRRKKKERKTHFICNSGVGGIFIRLEVMDENNGHPSHFLHRLDRLIWTLCFLFLFFSPSHCIYMCVSACAQRLWHHHVHLAMIITHGILEKWLRDS